MFWEKNKKNNFQVRSYLGAWFSEQESSHQREWKVNTMDPNQTASLIRIHIACIIGYQRTQVDEQVMAEKSG